MIDPLSVTNESFGLDPDAFAPREFLFDGGTIVTMSDVNGDFAYIRDDDHGIFLVNATTATTKPIRIDADRVAERVNTRLHDQFTTDVALHTELPDKLSDVFEFDNPDALTPRDLLATV